MPAAALRRVARQVGRQLAVIAVALAAGLVILGVSGFPPIETYRVMATAAFGTGIGLANTLRWATPLILIGLSVALSFRAGLFNIGAQGQFFVGAFAAMVIGLGLKEGPPVLVVPLGFAAAGAAGALWALLPGVLRAYWGTNEVISTLMMNFIALQFTNFLVRVPYNEGGSTGQVLATATLPPALRLATLVRGSELTLALAVALAMVVVAAAYTGRTTAGYEARVLGANAYFAENGGVNVRATIVTTFLLSGLLAGLAGAAEMYGPIGRFIGGLQEDLGFNGVVVSLMGLNTPWGILLSGLFFGGLQNASQQMRLLTDVPRALVTVLQGLVTIAVTAQILRVSLRRPRTPRGGQQGRTERMGEPGRETQPVARSGLS